MDNNNQRNNQQSSEETKGTQSQGATSGKVGQKPQKDESNDLSQEIENPAAQSEIGPNIYDIGMGGPGASTSGLRSGEDDDKDEE